jgi:hypothetical protein
MKGISRTVVVISAMIFGLATVTAAQMMGGNQGHMMTQKADSTSHSNTMSTADSLAARMSNSWGMMSQDFEKLDRQFQNMMKIDDMSMLKKEMEKYHQNMMLMRDDMTQEHDVCQMMTSMMESGGTNGMNGTRGSDSKSGAMGMSQTGSQGSQTHVKSH